MLIILHVAAKLTAKYTILSVILRNMQRGAVFETTFAENNLKAFVPNLPGANYLLFCFKSYLGHSDTFFDCPVRDGNVETILWSQRYYGEHVSIFGVSRQQQAENLTEKLGIA